MTATPNVPRLEHLLAWATEEQAKRERGEPSEWNQGVYVVDRAAADGTPPKTSCNTVCCIAGKIALEDGVEVVWTEHGYSSCVQVLGSIIRIDSYAEQVLGLTPTQADALFDAENNLEVLRETIEAIKRGESDRELEDLHQELIEAIGGELA